MGHLREMGAHTGAPLLILVFTPYLKGKLHFKTEFEASGQFVEPCRTLIGVVIKRMIGCAD